MAQPIPDDPRAGHYDYANQEQQGIMGRVIQGKPQGAPVETGQYGNVHSLEPPMRNLGGVIPSHLRERAATLAVLDRSLDECLPADCRAHCHVAAVQDATLVLVTDSPAWRSRLHFLSTTIIGHLNQLDNLTLEKVRIHVRQPASPTRAAPPRPSRSRPPVETARALDGLAAEVDEPALAAALRRLAARGRS